MPCNKSFDSKTRALIEMIVFIIIASNKIGITAMQVLCSIKHTITNPLLTLCAILIELFY